MSMAEQSRPVPRVSVCMPSSRAGAFFIEALQSAVTQTANDIEIIVTDDSGGDLEGSVRMFSDERVKYFRNPAPLGIAGNHLRALEFATGDFVAFLHDDDGWQPEFLTAGLAVLDA